MVKSFLILPVQVDPWAWPGHGGRSAAQVARSAGPAARPVGNGVDRRDSTTPDDPMSSSVLRACSAQYYTACLPPASGDLHRSGSANQLNGHAAGHLLHASSTSSPSSQPRQPASSAQTSPQPTAMNATASSAASPARPQRTHSERSQRTSRMSLYRSNSSLDLDHNNGGHHGGGGAAGEPGALRGGPTRRDYGSASSLDLLAASAADGSFFAMLREYRAGRREDQRR